MTTLRKTLREDVRTRESLERTMHTYRKAWEDAKVDLAALRAENARLASKVRAECAAELRLAQAATQSDRASLWEVVDERLSVWEAP